MNASELYREGKLQQAIEAQIGEVKANPLDHARRLFLFEMLAFAGELDRARKQADAIQYKEVELDVALQGYKKLLECEQARRRVFTEGISPKFLIEPAPEHVQLRLQAVNLLREKRSKEAAELLQRAAEITPEVRGEINDKPFELFRDADDLFGGILEVMAHGGYFWVPIEQVCSLASAAPRFPRDLLWLPARMELTDQQGEVFLPTLYPSSYQHSDPNIQLGRTTDWKGEEGEPILGVGLRTFLVGEDAISILDIRNLSIDHPELNEFEAQASTEESAE